MNLDKPCKPKVIGKNVLDYIKRQQELKDRKDAVEADRAKEIYVSISKKQIKLCIYVQRKNTYMIHVQIDSQIFDRVSKYLMQILKRKQKLCYEIYQNKLNFFFII